MQLEKVIGMSSRNNSSIAINPINGEIASTAGCVICIYNAKENKQTRFLFSRLQRSFSCLTYSHNGKYFAAGEGAFR
jgi:WD40 repeat protein